MRDAVDGRSGGHSPRHVQHSEPKFVVQADHLGRVAVAGCPRCASPAEVASMLRATADRIEAAGQQAQRPGSGS